MQVCPRQFKAVYREKKSSFCKRSRVLSVLVSVQCSMTSAVPYHVHVHVYCKRAHSTADQLYYVHDSRVCEMWLWLWSKLVVVTQHIVRVAAEYLWEIAVS